jgi:hypothetical protein
MAPADDYDTKLDNLQLSTKKSMRIEEDQLNSSIQSINGFGGAYNNPLYIERNKNNQFERTYLPQV